MYGWTPWRDSEPAKHTCGALRGQTTVNSNIHTACTVSTYLEQTHPIIAYRQTFPLALAVRSLHASTSDRVSTRLLLEWIRAKQLALAAKEPAAKPSLRLGSTGFCPAPLPNITCHVAHVRPIEPSTPGTWQSPKGAAASAVSLWSPVCHPSSHLAISVQHIYMSSE
jgi:hypothetical protein